MENRNETPNTDRMPASDAGVNPVQQEGPAAQQYWQGASYGQAQQPYGQTYQQSPVATAQKKSSAKAFGKTFLAGFLGAAVACAVGLGGFAAYQSTTTPSGGGTVLGGSGGTIEVTGDDATLAETVAQKALPSVVAIDVYTEQNSYGFFGYTSGSGELTESSLGSGVIISEDGYILTNEHVIDGASALKVTLSTGDQYEAQIVGSDVSSDLAVLKIDATGLTAVQIGNSSDLNVGEWVMTVGSPYGLEQSVATGIVSATNRSTVLENDGGTAYYTNMIQTDAAINPGNSGGALVDKDGALIGINAMITSSSGSYSGVGFAIPVDYAIGIAQQIIDGETPSHAQLGVSVASVDDQSARQYGLSTNSGALVTNLVSGGAAEKAGLQTGDVITKLNGQAVSDATDLKLAVRSVNPGDTVDVEYVRGSDTATVQVTLDSDESSQSAIESLGNSLRNGGSGSYGNGGYGNGSSAYSFSQQS